MNELEQIKLLTFDFTLTAEHIVIVSKIFIIVLFLTNVLLMKGSFNNPFTSLCEKTGLMKQLNHFLTRAKFTIAWTLFNSMNYYSYDLRITAVTQCGTKYEWFMIRDGKDMMDGRLKIHMPYSRVVISTHFFNLFKYFFTPFFIKAATEFCEDRAQTIATLVAEQVSFYSLSPEEELQKRDNPLSVTQTHVMI